ncbi:hypothetical protein GCM10027053_11820 [Intrasporangium mesophilum]
MDFNEQLDKLQQRASDTAASVRAAAAEDRAKLKQRIDQAQVDANLALKDTEQAATEAKDRAQSKWAQMKADARKKMDEVQAKAEKRADEIDAAAASTDADWAEADALDAIDYAGWAVENARLAALDALDARARADELAAVAKS